MLKLKIKPKAEEDLGEIYEYTAMRWGIDQAEKYQDDLYEGMLLVAEQDGLGKEYAYTKLPYRKLHVNRHLIFYRVEDQSCLIIRVLHDRMDIEKHVIEKRFDV